MVVAATTAAKEGLCALGMQLPSRRVAHSGHVCCSPTFRSGFVGVMVVLVVMALDFFSCPQGSHDRIQFSRCSCCVGIECNMHRRCTDCIRGSGHLTETDDDDDEDSDYVACK